MWTADLNRMKSVKHVDVYRALTAFFAGKHGIVVEWQCTLKHIPLAFYDLMYIYDGISLCSVLLVYQFNIKDKRLQQHRQQGLHQHQHTNSFD